METETQLRLRQNGATAVPTTVKPKTGKWSVGGCPGLVDFVMQSLYGLWA